MQLTRKFLISCMMLSVAGCVTFKSPNILEREAGQETPLCVELGLKYVDEGILGSKQITALPSTYQTTLIRSLSSFGIQTNCNSPQVKLDILIEEKNKIGFLKGLWAATSFFTLGIVPFIHNEDVQISISKANEIIVEESFEAKKVVSIIYVVKMFSENSKSLETFNIPTRSEAEFGYAVATGIRKAIQKSSFKVKNDRPDK